MKKLLKLITMLFLASAMVISCGGGSGSDAPSTSDCTETVTTLELSDGEWTVYVSATNDFMTSETILEATVTNGDYEFTSGKGSATVDMEKLFSLMGDEMEIPEAEIEQFKNLPDELKNEFLFKFWGDKNTEGYDVSWDGLIANVEATASDEQLEGMRELYDFKALPDDVVIKTNADKTKFTFNVSFDGEEMEFIAEKK